MLSPKLKSFSILVLIPRLHIDFGPYFKVLETKIEKVSIIDFGPYFYLNLLNSFLKFFLLIHFRCLLIRNHNYHANKTIFSTNEQIITFLFIPSYICCLKKGQFSNKTTCKSYICYKGFVSHLNINSR